MSTLPPEHAAPLARIGASLAALKGMSALDRAIHGPRLAETAIGDALSVIRSLCERVGKIENQLIENQLREGGK